MANDPMLGRPAGQTQADAHPKRFPLRFGILILAASIVCLAAIVSTYELCMQDAEVASVLSPLALKNGNQFSWKDLYDAFTFSSKDGSRPRFIAYLAMILSVKTRLALWQILPPHPSFTPAWLLTLLLGPVLLYRFLNMVLGDRAASLVGVAVYLTSAGLLGGTVMFFHIAKPLSNIVIIGMFWYAENLNRRLNGNWAPRFWLKRIPIYHLIGMFALLALSPLVDETATFAFFIPVIWCPSLFWPPDLSRKAIGDRLKNWALLAAPAVAAFIIMFVLAPLGPELNPHEHFDLYEYLLRMVVIERFTPTYVLWHAHNLFSAELIPGSFDGIGVPVWRPSAGSPGYVLPAASTIFLIAAFALITFVVFRRKSGWSPYRKIVITIGLFILFHSCVLLVHPLLLVATGYYYGSIFSVLFATFMSIIFFVLCRHENRIIQWAAYILMVYTLVVSLSNFITIDRSWSQHENFKALMALRGFSDLEKFGNWKHLKELSENEHLKELSENRKQYRNYYDSEVDIPPGHSAFGNVMDIWRKFKRGDADLVGQRDVHLRDLWVLAELTRIRGN